MYRIAGTDNRGSIMATLMTSGIIDVVRAGDHPLPVDYSEVAALQHTVHVGFAMKPWVCIDTDLWDVNVFMNA